MSFAKRFRSGAVAAAALLAVLLLSSSVVLAEVVVKDVTNTSVTYDGAAYDFSHLSTYIYVTIAASTVSGAGMTISGKATGVQATDVGLSYSFSHGTIKAPVTFANSLVPNSAFSFTGSTITMSDSTASAFVFATGAFTSNTTFTFSQLTGTWPASASGSLLSARSTFSVASRSAIFVEQCDLTNVQSVLYVNPSSYVASVTGGSVVAVDDVTCTSCGAAVARLMVPLTVSQSSLFRVSQCNAGAVPLISESGSVTVSDGSLLSVTDSVSTGPLFALGDTPSLSLTGGSVLTLKNVTAAGTGLTSSNAIPTSSSADSATYGDAQCTFNDVKMTTQEAFLSYGLKVSTFLGTGDCAPAKCVPGLKTGLNSTGGCKCLCTAGTYQPSCTYMADPTGTTSSVSGACTLFKCTTCSPTDLSKCIGCEVDYTLVTATGTCVRTCTDANCAICGNDGVCTACNTGYTLLSDHSCVQCSIAHCATCSAANTCASCESGYSLYQNTCVPCSIPNCATCSSDGVCAACVAGYSLSSTGNACVQCNVANCAHCTTANVCDQCDTSVSRYTLTSSGTCVLCNVPNCKTCETENVCSACASASYTLSGGKCIACKVNRCATCTSENFCGTCQDGFTVSTTGECFICPKNCTTCSADNVCNTCPDGNTLVNGVCVPCHVEHCLQCNVANTCSVCTDDRVPDSTGQCVIKQACADGYYKDTDGTCKPNCNIAYCTGCSAPNVCSACEGSLVLSLDGRSCTCSSPACASCTPARCVECLAGYKMTSGFICVSITNAASSPLGLVAALLSLLVAALAVMSL